MNIYSTFRHHSESARSDQLSWNTIFLIPLPTNRVKKHLWMTFRKKPHYFLNCCSWNFLFILFRSRFFVHKHKQSFFFTLSITQLFEVSITTRQWRSRWHTIKLLNFLITAQFYKFSKVPKLTCKKLTF